jgi:hypothetical protein
MTYTEPMLDSDLDHRWMQVQPPDARDLLFRVRNPASRTVKKRPSGSATTGERNLSRWLRPVGV